MLRIAVAATRVRSLRFPRRAFSTVQAGLINLEVGWAFRSKKQPEASPPTPGEDSLFFGRNDMVYALGVADGVTDCALRGLGSSAEVAQGMMRACSVAVKAEVATVRKPDDLVKHAYDYVMQQCLQKQLSGSSTLCVATVDKTAPHLLRVANIGDSGFMLLRRDRNKKLEPNLKSKAMLHGPFFPYQFGCFSRDEPSDAETYSGVVHPGDVLLMATDGLYDNVFYDTICEVAEQALYKGGVWKAAQDLVDAAFRNANGSVPTPISHRGGRMDDVTVVLAHVVPSN
eukprot:TRINITY_DN15701_c0_g1_i1.p1 TRINITY_DN15701_c0_g1~~TRINITY_DN15701_c0_g1_i1.p1  ORF type:complete len:285 (+),score=39.23 TRINITY_DN15701_c0_g1_i1:66-920(+)